MSIKKGGILATGILLVALAICPSPLEGQAKPSVKDLTTMEPSTEDLIEVLKPREPPPYSGTRGLGSRGIAVNEPVCEYYRQAQTRGIAVKYAADIAAIKVLFRFDSAVLSPDASRTLDTLGEALNSGELRSCCFLIEGHTDHVGSETYNLDLSQRRAESVARYLAESFGLAAQRLLTNGRGEAQPIMGNATEEGRRKNRRVQIVNLGFFRPAEP